MKRLRYILIAVLVLTFIFSTSTIADTPSQKLVLLTFDDGPDPRYTPQILDTLKENNIKAMFFVVGNLCEENPDLLQRVVAEGHALGNHTNSHTIIKGKDKEVVYQEVISAQHAIYRFSSQLTNYFRPPTGAYSEEQAPVLAELNQKVLMWDLGLEKRNLATADDLVEHLVGRIGMRNELVILMHDGSPRNRYDRSTTVEALPLLITELQQQGFQFVDPSSPAGIMFVENYMLRNPKVGVY